LHLGNVTEFQGKPLPFDGIAFDPELRWIDTMNDLAFLVSDLEFRNRPDLGRLVLDAYLEESGDYAGLKLWDYYTIYRWMVRTKVLALSKNSPASDLDRYLALAESRTKKPKPILVCTHGLSGSGKTWFSQQLIQKMDIIRLRSDVVRKQQGGLAPTQFSDSGLAEGLYSSSNSEATYQLLAEYASELLRAGHSVIVDATFLQRSRRDLFVRLADLEQVPYHLVHLEAAEEDLRQGIAARTETGDASEADGQVLDLQMRTQDELSSSEPYLTPESFLALRRL